MDISNLTVAQLRDLQQRIPAELKRREGLEKAHVLDELRAFSKARGYALEELLGKELKIKSSTGSKVKVKYRHPENPELEWTGRGRKPKWFEACLAEGRSPDSLLVQ